MNRRLFKKRRQNFCQKFPCVILIKTASLSVPFRRFLVLLVHLSILLLGGGIILRSSITATLLGINFLFGDGFRDFPLEQILAPRLLSF